MFTQTSAKRVVVGRSTLLLFPKAARALSKIMKFTPAVLLFHIAALFCEFCPTEGQLAPLAAAMRINDDIDASNFPAQGITQVAFLYLHGDGNAVDYGNVAVTNAVAGNNLVNVLTGAPNGQRPPWPNNPRTTNILFAVPDLKTPGTSEANNHGHGEYKMLQGLDCRIPRETSRPAISRRKVSELYNPWHSP